MLNTQQPGDGGSRMGFPDWLTRVCGRSRATAEAYARDTAAYMDWAAGQGLTAAQALNRAQLGLYLMERMQPKRRWAGEERQLGARSAARKGGKFDKIYFIGLFNGCDSGIEEWEYDPLFEWAESFYHHQADDACASTVIPYMDPALDYVLGDCQE